MMCPRCGLIPEIELPVPPLWTIDSAALLIPMKSASLKRWLRANRALVDAPRYIYSAGRYRRFLTSDEIRLIRGSLLRAEPASRKTIARRAAARLETHGTT